MALLSFNQSLTVHGVVTDVQRGKRTFSLKSRSGDVFDVAVGSETYYQVIGNLDNLSQDRIPELVGEERNDKNRIEYDLAKYIVAGRPVTVGGVWQQHGPATRFEARAVRLMHSKPESYVFEETHWWILQTTQMADRILDHLFDARRSYTIDDFSKFYRTQLNILGQQVDETVQECAVLSRLLYDLSTAYLLTGAQRYFLAAKAAAGYLREAFRSPTHDGEYMFWAYGRRRNQQGERGEMRIFASQGPDDKDTIALYEQIYALAGLTQYYRMTLDREVLNDIRLTINAFQAFFHDYPGAAKEKGFAGTGGYYSHLDPVTMRPDSPELGVNSKQKNWNSIGDHIPGYLINLILTLDPLPDGKARPMLEALLKTCLGILDETSTIIVEKFPDPDAKVDYVRERFRDNWEPILDYRWQQNRAVVGHNLKIAWNLTRVAFYYQTLAWRASNGGKAAESERCVEKANRCLKLARKLGSRMGEVGLDKLRGGVFDCVEREPSGVPTQFAWEPTKDFWQQEQGILAYLILHGATAGDRRLSAEDASYVALARECSAFWNAFFLDRERQGYFFRVTENGLPVLEGEYGRKSGHAIGYHAFELAYLAHMYTRTFMNPGSSADNEFCLYFNLECCGDQTSINVLPDMLPPNSVEITAIRANGIDVTQSCKPNGPNNFQISLKGLRPDSPDDRLQLVVRFKSIVAS